MEVDEWERTACGEIKREKHFWGEKFSSPLGLCCFFLAALAVFFWSPFVSFAFLLFPPAVEDWKTGYVSDHWSVFLAAAGLGHNVFYSRLTDGFISCAFVLGMYGLLFLLAKHAMGGGRHISFRCGCIMACAGFRTAFPVSFRFLRGYCRHGASFLWQNVPQGGDSFLPVHRVGRCGGIWRGSISASVLSIVALFYLRLFWFRLFYRLRRWR